MRLLNKILLFLPPVLWALFILFATIASTQTLTSLHLSDLFGWDKPIHITLFGTQAALLIRSIAKIAPLQRKHITYMCLLSALYGSVTEGLQAIITTSRTFDYFDLLANTAGCALIWYWYIRKLKKSNAL